MGWKMFEKKDFENLIQIRQIKFLTDFLATSKLTTIEP